MMEPVLGPEVNLEYVGTVDRVTAETERILLSAKTPERSAREWDWLIMLSWSGGQPYYWREKAEDGRARRVMWPEHERNKPLLANLITPRVDTLVGTEAFTPRYVGRNTAQLGTEDYMKVRAAGDAANHGVGVVRLGTKKLELDHMKHTLGLAWLKVQWDPSAGTYVEGWDQVPCPTCNGTSSIQTPTGVGPCLTCASEGAIAQEMGEEFKPGFTNVPMGSAPEGEVVATVHPPWEVFADPSAPDPKRPHRLVHEYLMDRDDAWNHWFAGTDIPKDKMLSGGAEQMTVMLAGWANGSMLGDGANLVTVRETFVTPTDEWPEGLHAVIVGGVVMVAEPLPAHRRITYTPFRCYPRINRYFPASTVERMLPIQYAHHKLMWQIQDAAEFAANTRILKPKGVGMQVDDMPGITSYTQQPGMATPQFMKDPGLSQDVYSQLDRLERQADEVSYATPLLRGESRGESSARHDAWLEQRQLQPMKRMLEDNAESLKKVGEDLVDTIKENYAPGRQFRDVFGAGGQMLVREFASDRMGSSANVELIPERDVGRTLSSRRDELIALKTAGFLDDPRLMQMAEIASPDAPFYEDMTDEQAALFENQQVVRYWDLQANPPQFLEPMPDPMTGEVTPPQLLNSPMDPPSFFENHVVHKRVHIQEFNRLKMTYGLNHPYTQAMRDHLDQTLEMEAQQQARVQALAAQAAASYGMGNAADPNAQPAETVEAAGEMGAPDASATAPVPGEPETQESLQQVDANTPR